jgi:signal transduction histidine kinase
MIDYSFNLKPYNKFSDSGDFQLFEEAEDFHLIVVGDVGGHANVNIFSVAEKCKKIIKEKALRSLQEIIETIHDLDALKKYGLALFVAKIYKEIPVVEYINIGTNKLKLIRNEKITQLSSQDGIVGYQIRSNLKINLLKLQNNDILIIVTDGITLRSEKIKHQINFSRSSQNIADEVQKYFNTGHDDALCTVLKFKSNELQYQQAGNNLYKPEIENLIKNIEKQEEVVKIEQQEKKKMGRKSQKPIQSANFRVFNEDDTFVIRVQPTDRLQENIQNLFSLLYLDENIEKYLLYVILQISSQDPNEIIFYFSEKSLQVQFPISIETYRKIYFVFNEIKLVENKNSSFAVVQIDFLKNISIETLLNSRISEAISVDTDIETFKTIEKERDRERIFNQQSKHAMMGEMIGAIAHQWRQPLAVVSGNLFNIEDECLSGEFDEEFLRDEIETAEKSLNYMSNTIDDFRNFFAPTKNKRDFSVEEAIVNSISIVFAQLKSNNISVFMKSGDFEISEFYEKKKSTSSHIISGYPNEFTQVILNILSNSKDAIIENGIENGEIQVVVTSNNKMVLITIIDNGGGIPQGVIDRVFEPYYTTKEEGKGTGIGLYMSKMIIEDNMNGIIEVENIQGGASFKISFECVKT